MSDHRFDHAVRTWLESGSDQTPPAAIDAVLLAVKTTPQERDLRIPRRFTQMSFSMRLAAGIAIVAVAGIAALTYFYNGPGFGATPTPAPTSSPVPTASPRPSPALPTPLPTLSLDTGTWTPFTSSRYGFVVAYPEGWTAIPASRDFVLETDRTSSDEVASDLFIDDRVPGDAQVLLSAFAATVPDGTSETAWIDAYHAPESGDTSGCRQLSAAMTPVVIDGQPALLGTNCDWYDAFVSVGSRMYVFTVWRPDQRAVAEAFLSTVQLP